MCDQRMDMLKAGDWDAWRQTETDQRQGKPEPAWCHPASGTGLVSLPEPQLALMERPLGEILQQRRSWRRFAETALTSEQLSTLLWSVQGISGSDHRRRTAPSAGARHPFETYAVLRHVAGLKAGVYRYQVENQQLFLLKEQDDLGDTLTAACLGQGFVGQAPLTILFSAVPDRTAWRYGSVSPKLIALDAGHVMQNLYLAAEAMGLGTCAIGAYDQEALDRLAGVDREQEFVIYAAPVGVPQT